MHGLTAGSAAPPPSRASGGQTRLRRRLAVCTICTPLLDSGDEKQHPPGGWTGGRGSRTMIADAGTRVRFPPLLPSSSPPAYDGFFFSEGISHSRDSSDVRWWIVFKRRIKPNAGYSRVIVLFGVHHCTPAAKKFKTKTKRVPLNRSNLTRHVNKPFAIVVMCFVNMSIQQRSLITLHQRMFKINIQSIIKKKNKIILFKHCFLQAWRNLIFIL